jgi:hypothetical protein
MEYSIDATAQSFDAKTFISHTSDSKMPAMLKQSVHTFSLDKTVAGKIFGSSSKDLQLNNFPIGLNAIGTVDLSLSQSVIDANTIIMIGNKRVPVPSMTTYQGSIKDEKGSTVLISYIDGEMYGWISRSNGITISFAPEDTKTDIRAYQ